MGDMEEINYPKLAIFRICLKTGFIAVIPDQVENYYKKNVLYIQGVYLKDNF